MRCIDNIFIGSFSSPNRADNVVRFILTNLPVHGKGYTRIQQHAFEAGMPGLCLSIVEIKAGCCKYFLDGRFCDPANAFTEVSVSSSRIQVQMRIVPARLENLEWIAGWHGIVDHKTTLRPLARGLFELVRPTSIIRHGVPFEKGGIITSESGIVHKDNDDFVLDV